MSTHRCPRLLRRARHDLRHRLAHARTTASTRSSRVLVDVGQAFDIDEAILRGTAAGAADVILLDRKERLRRRSRSRRPSRRTRSTRGSTRSSRRCRAPSSPRRVASLALELGAEAVVHGCTGKGNDQLRFELAFKANYPGVNVIAPLRDRIWTREEEIAYALERGIPITRHEGLARTRSTRTSSAARSRPGMLEDPVDGAARGAVPADGRPGRRTGAGRASSSRFERGIPVALDGDGAAALADSSAKLNERAGAVRDRADRHDREPSRRHQEPRGLRGPGGDGADPGPPRARGSRS